MRLILATALASLLVTPALADTMKNCFAAWAKKPAAEKSATTYPAFSAACLKNGVSANAVPKPPAGATAVCNDGTYSTSKAALGRCSGHGGVAAVLGRPSDNDND